VLLGLLAWTREWSRFGPWPDAVAYGALVVFTLGLLAVPVWWLRRPILEAVDRTLSDAPGVRRAESYLFDGPDPRWKATLALAAVTLLVGLAVLGRFNDMLGGMHAPGVGGAGISDLAGVTTFDLSTKTGVIAETVDVWQQFDEGAGPGFPSARAIVTAHVLIDALLVVPSYVVAAVIVLMWLRRRRGGAPDATLVGEAGGRLGETFDLLSLFGLTLVAGLALADLAENFFTWYVVERSWTGGAVTELNARILWMAALVKVGTMSMLGVAGLLIVAMRRFHWPVLRTFVVVRAQLVVVLGLAVALFLPRQMSDVVRRWTAAECLIAVGLASFLAMLLSRFARAALRSQATAAERGGEAPAPAMVAVPWLGERRMRSVAVAGLLAAAAVQLILDVATPMRVGKGLLIPSGIVAIVWALGTPLPSFPRRRKPTRVPDGVASALPALIGGLVFVLLGVSVIRAAVGHLLAAGAEEWWLLLASLPIAVGIWRIHRRGYRAIGGVELAGAAAIVATGALLIAGGDPQLNPTSLVVVGFLITYGAFPFHYSHRSAALVSRFVAGTRLYRVGFHPLIAAGVTVTALVVGWTIWMPIEVAGYLGAIAVVLLAGILLAHAGWWAVRFAERTDPPRFLAAFGMARTPMFGLVVAWYLLAPLVASEGAYDVEIVAGGDHEVAAIGVEDVWERWTEANGIEEAATGTGAPGDGRPAVPLVLVSSSGGGARAAVWTGFVADCVFAATPDGDGIPCAERRADGDVLHSVATMSGVSGGALGLASFAASRESAPGRPDVVDSDVWVEEVLGDDYLAAPLAWYLFVDIPRELLGFSPAIRDRGEILERAWEKTWVRAGMPVGLDTGLYEMWYEHPAIPPLVFSGTSVADACRFNASVLDVAVSDPTGNCRSLAAFDDGAPMTAAAFPATHDLADFLCPGDDIRLSTAVNLSARYPFLAPSGRVPPREGCTPEEGTAVHVVDGGYLEGSGAGTLLDLWRALEPLVERHNATADTCIVPFALHIDNGYESLASVGGSAPNEVAVPLVAYWGAQTGRLATARASLALTFDQPLTVAGEPLAVVAGEGDGARQITSRFARVTTWAHPGVQAPLGWSLSQASIDDLRDQLFNEQNTAQLLEIASWLDGSLRCGS
jgi:hypothetical protein